MAVGNRSVAGWCSAVLGAVLPLVLAGCGSTNSKHWGDPVDISKAVPLSQALNTHEVSNAQNLIISGRITEVCKSSGCWFVLQDSADGRDYQIYVDLTHGANFTVPPDIQGRKAVVKGRITGDKPDLKFYAVGLVLV